MGSVMTAAANDHRASALVWIDAREALIVRMQGDRGRIERVESEVPGSSPGHRPRPARSDRPSRRRRQPAVCMRAASA